MTIQSVMLISLGFFVACILAMLLAPAYRHRAERLAADRVRRALPVSMDEIKADKDRLKARHAIEIHRLETHAEEARLNAARQRIEMNRRDAKICALEDRVTHLTGELEEHVNARRVLEHNISDRLPKVMERLDRAHKLIIDREQEIEDLNAGTQRGRRALEEAMRLNVQHRAEIDRLHATLATRTTARYASPEARSDTELALRSELEALRNRTRDQAGVITRLQELLSRYGEAAAADAKDGKRINPEKELAALRRDLSEARATLKLASVDVDEHALAASGKSVPTAELASMKSKIDDQATEIKRLSAALKTFEEADETSNTKRSTLRDTRIAVKARINSLQAQVTSQDDTIKRLRTELAASNERLARLTAQHRDEMRRLGSGTRQTTGQTRGRGAGRRKPTLTDRIGPAKWPAVDETGQEVLGTSITAEENGLKPANANGDADAGAIAETLGETSVPKAKVAQFLKPSVDGSASKPDAGKSTSAEAKKDKKSETQAGTKSSTIPSNQAKDEPEESKPADPDAATQSRSGEAKEKAKPRLMDRIASLGRN